MHARANRKSFWDWYFFDWFPAENLGVVRAYFGALLAVYLVTQYFQLLGLDAFGHQFHYTIPIWYFDWLGIESNIPWVIFPVFLAMLCSCLLFAAGRQTKFAIVAIIICIFYLKGVRDSFSGDVHHRELPIIAILLLFLFSHCERVFSLDARKPGSAARIEDWEASWPLRAMQTYVAFFYLWALVAKLRVSGLDWFTGGGRIQDILIERAVRDGFDSSGQPVNLSLSYDLAQMPDLVWFLGALVFAFELLFPLILLVRSWRLRLVMLICTTVFHSANFLLLNVKFYFYPFVFLVFFNMVPVHAWLKSKLRVGRRLQVQRSAAD